MLFRGSLGPHPQASCSVAMHPQGALVMGDPALGLLGSPLQASLPPRLS